MLIHFFRESHILDAQRGKHLRQVVVSIRIAPPAGARAQDHKIIQRLLHLPEPAPVGCALC